MRLFTFIILFYSFSCSVFANELTSSQSATALAFDSTNQKIHGDALRAYKEDLSNFTLQAYKGFLDEYTSIQPHRVKEALADFDVQEFDLYKETFVFCVYSSSERFAMCDDPQCTSVEKKEAGVDKDILATWKKDLPLSKCPK